MGIVMDVSNLSYSDDYKLIFDDISFSLEESSVNALLCSNNGGKTTLISLLSGITPFKNGRVVINNIVLNKENFKKYILNISTILEDIEEQFICDTVEEEIKYPLINLRYSSSRISTLFEEIVSLLKISNISNKRVKDLSYFEKVKVLIAASIIHSPKVLLIDDIMRFLSKTEKQEIINLFNIISKEMGITILFTTSDLSTLLGITNIYVLDNGKIVMNGDFNSIIVKDNELSKMGIEIPLMVDLSRKLQFYKLVDKIYYDPDKVVDALWK